MLRNGCLLILFVLVGSCSNLRSPQSGILESYDELSLEERRLGEKMAGDEVRVYRAQGANFHVYRNVLIDRARVPNVPAEKRQADLEKLAEYLDRELADALGRKYRIVNRPGPDTLLVRTAIADFNRSSVALNAFTSLLLIPLDNGGVASEIEISDYRTKKVLYAESAAFNGSGLKFQKFFRNNVAYFAPKGHARIGLTQAVERVARTCGIPFP